MSIHLKTFFFIAFRERKEGRETLMRKRSTDWFLPTSTWTGDWTHNPGMCPNWELNPQPFGYRMMFQPTESHQSGPFKKGEMSPSWCRSVDWARACKPKGCGFDSQSEHMPGLWDRSPVGGEWQATTHWCFSPSLSPSLPLSLKIN